MKEKFFLILSPINLATVVLMDCACVYFSYLAVVKILAERSKLNIAFVAIMAFMLCVAVLTTIQLFKNGVKFHSDRVEFTGVDNDNEYLYSDIKDVKSHKDTKASFKKNFVDRYSSVIIYLKDDRVATINLGLTTTKTLNSIINELKSRI